MWYVCDQSLIYYEPSILGWIRSKPLIYWAPLIKSEPLIISLVIQSRPSIQILLMMQSEPLIHLWPDPSHRILPIAHPIESWLPPPQPMRRESLFLFPKWHTNQSHLLIPNTRALLGSSQKFWTGKIEWGEEEDAGAEDWSPEAPILPLQAAQWPLGAE
jgi:hypothetical protein